MFNATSYEGSLVRIRFATIRDAPAMLAAMRPEATQNLQFFEDGLDLQRQTTYLQRMLLSTTEQLFVIEEMSTGRMVGTIGLHEIDTHIKIARVGLLIFDPVDRHQGFGNMATHLVLGFAFDVLGLNKVSINLFAENVRGQEHWQKLGFIREGLLRQEYLLRGV